MTCKVELTGQTMKQTKFNVQMRKIEEEEDDDENHIRWNKLIHGD